MVQYTHCLSTCLDFGLFKKKNKNEASKRWYSDPTSSFFLLFFFSLSLSFRFLLFCFPSTHLNSPLSLSSPTCLPFFYLTKPHSAVGWLVGWFIYPLLSSLRIVAAAAAISPRGSLLLLLLRVYEKRIRIRIKIRRRRRRKRRRWRRRSEAQFLSLVCLLGCTLALALLCPLSTSFFLYKDFSTIKERRNQC